MARGRRVLRPWGSMAAMSLALIPGRAVVLATGGVGGLYAHTTNPLSALGGGLALAARAGAVLRDLEFVQFHPTAIAAGTDPMPLATEALRGEGAVLVNSRASVSCRGPGARAGAARCGGARDLRPDRAPGERVFLDARAALGERFVSKFPGRGGAVPGRRHRSGPRADPGSPGRALPHGRDQGGRSRPQHRAGLWACGEVASTGLHGANRLASNSLLEALAYARLDRRRHRGRWQPQPSRDRRPPSVACGSRSLGDQPSAAAGDPIAHGSARRRAP